MSRHCLIIALLLALPAVADRRADLQKYAKNAPAKTLPALAAYLEKPTRSETEKAWVIYCYVTSHITYDYDALEHTPRPDASAANTLKRRKGVCEGFATLYEDLAQRMGLECYHISGITRNGLELGKTDHVWDVVYADNAWHLADPTWNVFFPDPARFVHTHLPYVDRWQLLPTPWTRAHFVSQPVVTDEGVRLKVRPVSHLANTIVAHGPLTVTLNAPDYVTLTAELWSAGHALKHVPKVHRNTIRLNLPAGKFQLRVYARAGQREPALAVVYHITGARPHAQKPPR